MLFLNLLSFEMHVLSRVLGDGCNELDANLWQKLSCPGGWAAGSAQCVGALTP